MSWPHDTHVVTIRRSTSDSFITTSRLDLHEGQERRFVLTRPVITSFSQARHLNCIMGAMKPLVMILLLATAAQAQTIADAARKERERQARVQSVRVITPEAAKAMLYPIPAPAKPAVEGEQPTVETETTTDAAATTEPAPTTEPAAETTAPTEAAPVTPPVVETPAPPAAPPGPDLVRKYQDDLAALRAKRQQLQDKEVSLQQEINNLTNQLYAPKNSENAKRAAQDTIGKKQNELTGVRTEIDQAQRQILQMEQLGPPRPPQG